MQATHWSWLCLMGLLPISSDPHQLGSPASSRAGHDWMIPGGTPWGSLRGGWCSGITTYLSPYDYGKSPCIVNFPMKKWWFSIVMLNYQRVYIYIYYWLVVWNLNGLWLSIDWDCHHPNWRTHIFQRGRSTTNQIKYPMKVNNLSLYVRGILPFPILVFFSMHGRLKITDHLRELVAQNWRIAWGYHGSPMIIPEAHEIHNWSRYECHPMLYFFELFGGWADFFCPFFSGPRFYSNKGMFCFPGLAILKQHRDWDQNISSRRDRTWTPE